MNEPLTAKKLLEWNAAFLAHMKEQVADALYIPEWLVLALRPRPRGKRARRQSFYAQKRAQREERRRTVKLWLTFEKKL